MAYNFDPTKPAGTQPGSDMDDAIRDTRAGTIALVGTEHAVDVSNPAAVTAKHALGSARAGYNTYANRPTTGSGIETGRLFVASDSKQLMHGNGSAVTYTDVDTVDGAHAGTAANNVLKLDSGGKVPLANIPTSVWYAGNVPGSVIPLLYSTVTSTSTSPSQILGCTFLWDSAFSKGRSVYFECLLGGIDDGTAYAKLRDVTAGTDLVTLSVASPTYNRLRSSAITPTHGNTLEVFIWRSAGATTPASLKSARLIIL
jgi:hypothetical protein